MKTLVLCLVYVLLGALFDFNSEVSEFYSALGIVLISLTLLFELRIKFKNEFKVFGVALVVRLLMLYLDYSVSGVSVPHSGMDSETFYRIAFNNIGKPENLRYYLTNYTVLLTFLFDLMGPQRLFAQFINVLLGMVTLVYLYKSLVLCRIGGRAKRVALWTTALMPQMVIFSAILLRESMIIALTMSSFYFFLKYIKSGELGSLIPCFVLALGSAALHSGMLGLFVGYIVGLVLYDRSSRRIQLSLSSIVIGLFALIFLVIAGIQSGLATGYISFLIEPSGVSSSELLLERVNNDDTMAGSAYLQWVNSQSIIQLLVFSPLYIIHLMFSPLPWYWRGVPDVVAFLFDSLFYLSVVYVIFKRRSKGVSYQWSRGQLNLLLLGVFLSVFMYALGTGAAGTAIRHRANFFPVLVLIAAMAQEKVTSKRVIV